ncbi:zonadhesin [Acrasis kona]|uniref:Zonadhesin n=1 Tax=Acrasis kona TaxID=1008807 RepID=A0AAW2Z8K4_9EUKA
MDEFAVCGNGQEDAIRRRQQSRSYTTFSRLPDITNKDANDSLISSAKKMLEQGQKRNNPLAEEIITQQLSTSPPSPKILSIIEKFEHVNSTRGERSFSVHSFSKYKADGESNFAKGSPPKVPPKPLHRIGSSNNNMKTPLKEVNVSAEPVGTQSNSEIYSEPIPTINLPLTPTPIATQTPDECLATPQADVDTPTLTCAPTTTSTATQTPTSNDTLTTSSSTPTLYLSINDDITKSSLHNNVTQSSNHDETTQPVPNVRSELTLPAIRSISRKEPEVITLSKSALPSTESIVLLEDDLTTFIQTPRLVLTKVLKKELGHDEDVKALSSPIREVLLGVETEEYKTTEDTFEQLVLSVGTDRYKREDTFYDVISSFIQEEEDYLHLLGTISKMYKEGLLKFRQTFYKYPLEHFDSATSMLDCFESLAVEEHHLNLLRLKKHIIKKTVSEDPNSDFLTDLSDLVMMFVQDTLCEKHLKHFIPRYSQDLRPKVQSLLFESGKVMKLYIEKTLDPKALEKQQVRNKILTPCTFLQIMTLASQRLTHYLVTFRDHIFKRFFSEMKPTVQISKLQNAISKLQHSMKLESEDLLHLYQTNRLYNVQSHLEKPV